MLSVYRLGHPLDAQSQNRNCLGVPSMGSCCETKSVEIGENRSGLPCETGPKRSELVKTGPKFSQIEPDVPRNTKIPREEASKSCEVFDEKKLHGGLPKM